MSRVNPLVISKKAIKEDPALKAGARGARKIAVTSLYEGKEELYVDSQWKGSSQVTPVMLLENAEFAVFTHETVQDRHFHKLAHEFYTVLDGEFHIEVDGKLFHLTAGETIIVPPHSIHEVLRKHRFTAQVVTINCSGVEDKFIP